MSAVTSVSGNPDLHVKAVEQELKDLKESHSATDGTVAAETVTHSTVFGGSAPPSQGPVLGTLQLSEEEL